jgi:MoxR-like ATPase
VLRGIVQQTLQPAAGLSAVLDGRRLDEMLLVARSVPVASPVVDYAVTLIEATHPEVSLTHIDQRLDQIHQFVRAGASPRGLQALVTCAQVRALLEGRFNVSIEDLQALARPTLRHRILLNFEGQAEGLTTDQIIDGVLEAVPKQ